MEIEEKSPFATPFEWIGGEERVHALTERFYDLMDLEPAYTQLRAAHGTDLVRARQHLFWFLCGWLGGPQHYTDRFGHPRLRMRHGRVPVDGAMRDAWLRAMTTALDEQGVTGTLRGYLDARFAEVADFLRNTPG